MGNDFVIAQVDTVIAPLPEEMASWRANSCSTARSCRDFGRRRCSYSRPCRIAVTTASSLVLASSLPRRLRTWFLTVWMLIRRSEAI